MVGVRENPVPQRQFLDPEFRQIGGEALGFPRVDPHDRGVDVGLDLQELAGRHGRAFRAGLVRQYLVQCMHAGHVHSVSLEPVRSRGREAVRTREIARS